VVVNFDLLTPESDMFVTVHQYVSAISLVKVAVIFHKTLGLCFAMHRSSGVARIWCEEGGGEGEREFSVKA